MANVRRDVNRAHPPPPARAFEGQARAWAVAARAHLTPHLPFLLGVLLATVLAALPTFQPKMMSGHDAEMYLPRNVEFYAGLSAGQLFPRWAPDFDYGYGEPFFSFSPPVIYYLSAMFHALGFGFVEAANHAAFALLLLGALGMYALAAEFFGPLGGLVSAVAYVFAPYVLVALYVRGALSDFSAFAFIPFVFWGLYRFTRRGRFGGLSVGAGALALLLLSSNPVALITLPAVAALPCLVAWAMRDWRPLARGVACVALGLGLAAFFWAPALLERDFVQVSRLLEGYFQYGDHFVYPQQLVSSPWGYGLSVAGPDDGMSFAIGPVHLLLAGAAVLLVWPLRRVSRQAQLGVAFFLGVLVVAAVLSTGLSAAVWERVALLQYLEFPWRFLSLVAVATAFLCGLPLLLIPRERRWLRAGAAAALIAALCLLGFPHARPEAFLDVTAADYAPAAMVAQGVRVNSRREFMPVWVSQRPTEPAEAEAVLLTGEGTLTPLQRSAPDLAWQMTLTTPARVQVNTFYFPGWTLYVDGARRPIEFDNREGVMEFTLERGTHDVGLVFEDTPVRRGSALVSLLSALMLLGWLLGWTRRMSAPMAARRRR